MKLYTPTHEKRRSPQKTGREPYWNKKEIVSMIRLTDEIAITADDMQ